MQRRGEFELIAQVFAPLAKIGASPLASSFGLGDDAALVRPPPGMELVVSADAMVRGIHFDERTDPGDVGRKLLRVNLSDLATKGAMPVAYLLVAGWPADVGDEWINRFAAGLAEDQATYKLPLIGGDTIAMPSDLVLSVTIFGHVPSGTMLRRGGAQLGDYVYVSGTIGDARLGLLVAHDKLALPAEDAAFLRARLDRPNPRLRLGQDLRTVAHAAIDVSDGVLADLGHICEQSGVGAVVNEAALPLSAAAQRALAAVPGERPGLAAFGDDYEILFTVAPGDVSRLEALATRINLPLTRIGRIASEPGVRVVDAAGREVRVEKRGFQHF
ncbi:MAG: thiamine-phosphate kinase [Alphaproteobacteria bacterium]|nr:thiamine-phosphate kinase [Alphaproteobacteria bacterium]